MKQVFVHVDGSCVVNPGGRGGWACILECEGKLKEISGTEESSTNNRMELTAAIKALEALKVPCQVIITTDSEYLRKGITEYLQVWKRNGWRTSNRKEVKNQDLWRALDQAVQRHQIVWNWTKGHSGHEKNERCDWLAKEQSGAKLQ